MKTTSPDPRGAHTTSRPLLAVTALTVLLALSGCGSSDEAPDGDAGSASATASSSAASSPSATSAPPSATASGSPSAAPSTGSAQPTESAEPAAAEDQQSAAPAPAPEETRQASAPEAGMPTASPFDQQAADAVAAGSVCSAAQLSGTATPQQGAAGHTIASLTLTNTGSAPCVLNGYAGVSFVDAAGAPVGAPASQDAAGAGAVTLQPGASASAGLSITQPGVIGQVCNPHDTTGLRVYPPGSHESLVVSYPGQACGNPKVSQLQVKGFGG